MKVYLASPFFNEKELDAVMKAEQILEGKHFNVFSPRKLDYSDLGIGTNEWSKAIYKTDIEEIHNADVMVVLYHGNYSDSGTAYEIGYAVALGKKVILVHVDRHNDSNLMCHEGAHTNIYLDELENYNFDETPVIAYTGKMF